MYRLSIPQHPIHPSRSKLRGIGPIANEYTRRFVRWGIDIDLGATNDLAPAAMNFSLVPVALATKTYGDAFERMIYAVLAADTLQESGSISAEDHRYMIGKIIARYAGTGR